MRAYERGGAAALSVLTEPSHFGGSLDDLHAARAATHLPVLRKDFIVDAYQLVESAAAGADAILLIVAALEPDALLELHREARSLDLDVLVEVHDEEELEVALDVEAEVIGINNRDLGDFTVDIERTYELLSDVPAGKTVVSESGFSTREQLDELDRVGVDAVLIGETLMRAPDIEAACRELTGGGDRRRFSPAFRARFTPGAHAAPPMGRWFSTVVAAVMGGGVTAAVLIVAGVVDPATTSRSSSRSWPPRARRRLPRARGARLERARDLPAPRARRRLHPRPDAPARARRRSTSRHGPQRPSRRARAS